MTAFVTKSEYVYTFIRKKIVNGEWEQGREIVITDIINEFGVSHIPVREALKRLESDGLVENYPHKGFRVTLLDRQKIRQLLAIRAVLEGYAGRVVAENCSDELISKLEELYAQMDMCVVQRDNTGFPDLNFRFHREICLACELPMLSDMIFNLWDGGSWSRSIFSFYPNRSRSSNAEHAEIIGALKRRSPDETERLIREHKFRNSQLLESVSDKKKEE